MPRVIEIVRHAERYGVVPFFKVIPKFKEEYESIEEKYFRIWKYQLEFLKEHKRIEYDMEKETLVDILNRMDHEDERTIAVRVKLMDIDESFIIWTMYGKLSELCIKKPEDENQLDDLRKWKLLMIFEEHQEIVIDMSVAEGLGMFDHIIAWYALWRHWPTQYKVWEWTCNMKNLTRIEKIKEIGYSADYERYWSYVHEADTNSYPVRGRHIEWKEEHMCYWEKKVKEEESETYLPKEKK